MPKVVNENAKVETKKSAKLEGEKAAPKKELVTVKPSAMSVNVGPSVLATMDKAYKDEQKANELLSGVEAKRYDVQAQLTQAILKAATEDETIDLSATFAGDPKKMNNLNNQLGLALGFREVYTVKANDGSPIEKIDYSREAFKYFPTAKDTDKTSAEYKRKNTLRGNFLTLVKKCAQAAAGIQTSGAKVELDKDAGTLKLSGPAIEKTFGASEVLLNEKQTVGEGETAVKLLQKPSYTAIGRMGAEAEGKVLATRPDSRVRSATSPAQAIQSICQTLVDACGKLKDVPDDDTKRELSKAQNAIDQLLARK